MYKEVLDSEISNIKYQIQVLNNKLKNLPTDNLLCESAGKYVRWYYSNESGRHYLSKKNKESVLPLARKKYYCSLKTELEMKLNAAIKYSETLEKVQKSNNLLASKTYGPLVREALDMQFDNDIYDMAEYLNVWKTEKYDTNPFHPEKLIHQTISGHTVRSKSEVIIATSLYQHNIPFRYEAALTLSNGHIFYPDFTILHPKTLVLFYWEHFGMMDDKKYRDDAFHKMSIYGNDGIYPESNLLMTFETASHPLDVNVVEEIVRRHFL